MSMNVSASKAGASQGAKSSSGESGIEGQIKQLEGKKAGLQSQISNIEARANQEAGPHQQRADEEKNKPMGGIGAGLRAKAAQNTANTIAAPIMKEAEPLKAELKDVENRLQELYKQRDAEGKNKSENGEGDQNNNQNKANELNTQLSGLRTEKSIAESQGDYPKVREVQPKITDVEMKLASMRGSNKVPANVG